MPTNWDEFNKDLDTAIVEAGRRTDTKLAGHASSVTRLTDDEVKRLFPTSADVKILAELMEIVKRSGDRNKKVSQIVKNAEHFGGVILTLLSKLAG